MKNLPDIQSSKLSEKSQIMLDWVGIKNVTLPIRLFQGQPLMSARLNAGVNLTSSECRGIHMSRLYTLLEKKLIMEPIFDSLAHLVTCHKSLVISQEGTASYGSVGISFDYSYYHQSLDSEQLTQRVIPLEIEISGEVTNPRVTLSFELIYSSTCPQSYALATQSTVEAFLDRFQACEEDSSLKKISNLSVQEVVSWLEKGLVATPHAQRSLAKVFLSWTVNELNHWMNSYKTFQIGLESLISASEAALGTPSQSLVKRADEKKFAEINAANTMFCEDAARRLYECYSKLDVPQFFGEVRHFESLHPFDVIAQFGAK